MPRTAPLIRQATPADAVELLALWSATTRGTVTTDRAVAEAELALANLAANPDERLLVAEVDGDVVAAVALKRGQVSPLVPDPVVHTSFLLVLPQFRRHGYAHALLEAAVSWAEEKDVDHITAITDGNRDTNRFLARLGLVTLGTVRLTSTATLRKKLSAERSRLSGNRHLVEVISHRRSVRRRQAGY